MIHGDISILFTEIFPCFNLIKYFKNQHSKNHIFRGVKFYIFIDNITNKILTYTVTSSIYISKFILTKYSVLRKDLLPLAFTPEDIHPFLHEIKIIAKNVVIGYYLITSLHSLGIGYGLNGNSCQFIGSP